MKNFQSNFAKSRQFSSTSTFRSAYANRTKNITNLTKISFKPMQTNLVKNILIKPIQKHQRVGEFKFSTPLIGNDQLASKIWQQKEMLNQFADVVDEQNNQMKVNFNKQKEIIAQLTKNINEQDQLKIEIDRQKELISQLAKNINEQKQMKIEINQQKGIIYRLEKSVEEQNNKFKLEFYHQNETIDQLIKNNEELNNQTSDFLQKATAKPSENYQKEKHQVIENFVHNFHLKRPEVNKNENNIEKESKQTKTYNQISYDIYEKDKEYKIIKAENLNSTKKLEQENRQTNASWDIIFMLFLMYSTLMIIVLLVNIVDYLFNI